MSEHFNKLTPAEAELLALLAEECGELVQAICKVLRHGFESFNPDVDGHIGNRADLCSEMGDVQAAITLCCRSGLVKRLDVKDYADEKIDRVAQYLHHASMKP